MAWTKRRRKARVVWLPPAPESRIGINPAIAGYSPGGFQINLDQAAQPAIDAYVTGIIPLVSDIPSGSFQGSGLALETLTDIQGSGYRLRRIVGKVFVGLAQSSGATGDIPQVLVTCGIIVLRVNPDGTPLLPVADYDQYSPAIINSWADPWVWRRSWMLSNLVEATALGLPLYADTNQAYGSVMDGPHVDQKTARNVLMEERLFFVANAMTAQTAGGTGNSRVLITGDLRFVASMRRTSGNRGNASR